MSVLTTVCSFAKTVHWYTRVPTQAKSPTPRVSAVQTLSPWFSCEWWSTAATKTHLTSLNVSICTLRTLLRSIRLMVLTSFGRDCAAASTQTPNSKSCTMQTYLHTIRCVSPITSFSPSKCWQRSSSKERFPHARSNHTQRSTMKKCLVTYSSRVVKDLRCLHDMKNEWTNSK